MGPGLDHAFYCRGQGSLQRNQGLTLSSDRLACDQRPDDANVPAAALRNALARREPDGVVSVQAGRGWQFRAHSFQAVFHAKSHHGSMGRLASVGDNAATESCRVLLQGMF